MFFVVLTTYLRTIELVSCFCYHCVTTMLAARNRLVQRVALRICRRKQHPLASQLQTTTTRCFASGMDAFMEFEREMALKRMQNEVRSEQCREFVYEPRSSAVLCMYMRLLLSGTR